MPTGKTTTPSNAAATELFDAAQRERGQTRKTSGITTERRSCTRLPSTHTPSPVSGHMPNAGETHTKPAIANGTRFLRSCVRLILGTERIPHRQHCGQNAHPRRSRVASNQNVLVVNRRCEAKRTLKQRVSPQVSCADQKYQRPTMDLCCKPRRALPTRAMKVGQRRHALRMDECHPKSKCVGTVGNNRCNQ